MLRLFSLSLFLGDELLTPLIVVLLGGSPAVTRGCSTVLLVGKSSRVRLAEKSSMQPIQHVLCRGDGVSRVYLAAFVLNVAQVSFQSLDRASWAVLLV